MFKTLFNAGLGLSMLMSLPAIAEGVGPVTAIYAGGNNVDSRPCLFFQTNNAPPWYAVAINVPSSAGGFTILPGYADESKMIFQSYSTQEQLNFFEGSLYLNCGFQLAYGLYLGVAR
jgi:hypothetical protein